MMTDSVKPLIGIVMCQNMTGPHPAQTLHNKYPDAVVAAGGVPLPLPHQLLDAPELLAQSMALLDGLLLPGSPSNIEPWHYGEAGSEAHSDPARDRLAFAAITWATSRQMPLFGICRGLQELVVANGGALHRQLHQVKGFQDHREDPARPLSQQYAAAHLVTPEPGGLLSQLPDCHAPFTVNSLHAQGVRTPGPQLRIEARAADGVIEAVSLRHHPFALAVQWHPEWQSEQNPVSRQLFAAFIQAASDYHRSRP
ncbi:gamma-glutamyl-gamma-aminobutyrate hydrolase [Pantoea sp. UBA4549]|uniref:gamma-glutamyl-gamma-aminobutyrate hydrolase n=1 Tax=Pantoea sp. UBA4549 TaxID=1947033 RepID=UPI0025D24033|nr:gamma-glutamyl-gamma-aminobutyrate hydrolase [Pantoea sp. UBA4549]